MLILEMGWKNLPHKIININGAQFRVVLESGNIWWGILPRTNTRKIIDSMRNERSRSGIMKLLVPELKKSIQELLLNVEDKYDVITIHSRTNKGKKLYQSWDNLGEPFFKKIDTKDGIILKRKHNLKG